MGREEGSPLHPWQVVALTFALILGACVGSDVPGAPGASPSVSVAAVQVGADGCQYRYQGPGTWTPGAWCVTEIRPGVGDVYRFGHPEDPVATIDVSTPGSLRAFPYDIGLWLRMDDSGDGSFEVSFNHEWVSAGVYLDVLRRQIAAATLPSQRKGWEASLEAILLLSATHSRRLLNAAEIFTQPRCQWIASRCA